MTGTAEREHAYGETRRSTWVDRFGVWLSARRVRSCVGDLPGKRFADIGCGFHAEIARSFLGSVEHVVLVDVALSPELKARPGVTAIEGRLPDALADLCDASMDIVVCNSVLEHLWNPLETLKELYRLAAPGGICLVNVPSWRGKWFLEVSAFRLGLSPAEEMDDHKAYYDPRDLWPLLVEAGFKPRNIECFTHKFGLNTFAVCRKEGAGEGKRA